MLNRFYYITPDFAQRISPAAMPSTSSPSRPASLSEIILTYPIDTSDEVAMTSLLNYLYSEQGNYPFAIVLENAANTQKGHLETALLLLFHPYYARSLQGKFLFVWGRSSAEGQEGGYIGELLKKNKIEAEVILLPVDNNQYGLLRIDSKRKFFTVETTQGQNLADYYTYYCLHDFDPEDIFVIGYDKGIALDQLDRLLVQSADTIQSQSGLFYRLITEQMRLKEQVRDQIEINKILAAEKQTFLELLELNLKQDAVREILHFYKYEYEILPLWYKQFGHIIKVIMGRRSFRSLYNGNVKKYND